MLLVFYSNKLKLKQQLLDLLLPLLYLSMLNNLLVLCSSSFPSHTIFPSPSIFTSPASSLFLQTFRSLLARSSSYQLY